MFAFTPQIEVIIALGAVLLLLILLLIKRCVTRCLALRRWRKSLVEIRRIDQFAQPLLSNQLTVETNRTPRRRTFPIDEEAAVSEIEEDLDTPTHGVLGGSPCVMLVSDNVATVLVSVHGNVLAGWRHAAASRPRSSASVCARDLTEGGPEALGAAGAVLQCLSHTPLTPADGHNAKRIILPPSLRWDAWNALLGLPLHPQDTDFDLEPTKEFPGITTIPAAERELIELDVQRCRFGPFVNNRVNQAILSKLVCAWLVTNPECEYRQGFYTLAAVILGIAFYVKDAGWPVNAPCTLGRALKVLQALTDKFLPGAYIRGERSFMHRRLAQLAHVLGFWDPQLSVMLRDVDVDPIMFAQSWIVTLFADSLSESSIASVWDVMFSLDERFPVFLALALLVQVRNQFLACPDQSSCLMVISKLNDSTLLYDVQKSVRSMIVLWTHTPSSIARLEREPLPDVSVALNAGVSLPTVAAGDIVRLGAAACVIDLRRATQAERARFASYVRPTQCLQVDVDALIDQRTLAMLAALAKHTGDRRSIDRRRVAQLLLAHVKRQAPALWAVKGLCLALHADGEDPIILSQVADLLQRIRFGCLCHFAEPPASLEVERRSSIAINYSR